MNPRFRGHGGTARLAVPLGITGLQQIALDAELEPGDDGTTTARLRGSGKDACSAASPPAR
ncbi:MAG: hypothetical protein ACYCVZ_14385 [Streptosporangiaceae bacterium]